MRPNSDVFDGDAYLARVGLSGAPAQGARGLIDLHRAQALTIPFENFDVLLGRPLALTPAGLAAKLLGRRRGGYCFELNGLMLAALRLFGFPARPLLARVHVAVRIQGRTHQICRVRCEGRDWLCDVGFGGDGLLLPVPLEPGRVDEQAGTRYRLVTDPELGHILQIHDEQGWAPLYSFDDSHVTPSDIAVGNHYTSTHPASLFTRARVAVLPTDQGRRKLLNFTLTETRDGQAATQQLPDGPAYLEALATHFGVELDAAYTRLPAPADAAG